MGGMEKFPELKNGGAASKMKFLRVNSEIGRVNVRFRRVTPEFRRVNLKNRRVIPKTSNFPIVKTGPKLGPVLVSFFQCT